MNQTGIQMMASAMDGYQRALGIIIHGYMRACLAHCWRLKTRKRHAHKRVIYLQAVSVRRCDPNGLRI